MPQEAISSFPRISREVLDTLTTEHEGKSERYLELFTLEQPHLLKWLVEASPSPEEALMRAASMGFLYEALKRQMRKAE